MHRYKKLSTNKFFDVFIHIFHIIEGERRFLFRLTHLMHKTYFSFLFLLYPENKLRKLYFSSDYCFIFYLLLKSKCKYTLLYYHIFLFVAHIFPLKENRVYIFFIPNPFSQIQFVSENTFFLNN